MLKGSRFYQCCPQQPAYKHLNPQAAAAMILYTKITYLLSFQILSNINDA